MARIIGNTGSSRRRWSLFAAIVVALTMTAVVVPGALAASTGVSVVDYSQCANGGPNSGQDKTTCNGGWINGILNANNSQYAEDEVTAQRLVIDIPAGNTVTDHTITLRYLWNKSVNHAYDSLAIWNKTITGVTTAAAACKGVPGGPSGCPANGSNFNSGLGSDQFQIPSSPCSDNSVLNTSGQNDHQLADRRVVAFGADITGISTPVNDDTSCGTSADNYETVTITYQAPAGHRVMFLYGGHLAASLLPSGGSLRGWGGTKVGDVCTGCLGASSISGGPYHIKLDLLDGASAGNRDNQIMSSAVLPLTVSTISTTPSSSFTYSVTLDDSLTLGDLTTSGVSADFYLYGPTATQTAVEACAAGEKTTIGTGGLLYKKTGVTVASGTAATTDASGTAAGSNVVSPTVATTYAWVAHYNPDATHTAADSACTDETQTVTPPSNPVS